MRGCARHGDEGARRKAKSDSKLSSLATARRRSSTSPRTNTIYEQPDSARPIFTNPISQIRQELAAGQAQLVGSVVIGGASLYKIDLPNGLVGYFNKNYYRPRYLDDPQQSGPPVRLMVAAFEYLPMTPANRTLLSVAAQRPNARIESGPVK